ncbi:hypothetical protein [Streptomyces uncialis]|uniref:hypothetical protein n=1 Tax=Streptomyces uncialis TaxID=1048205 RepID=UPI00386E43F4|nr:hypothetical protein OG924_12460 [Streptomyces uncialis]
MTDHQTPDTTAAFAAAATAAAAGMAGGLSATGKDTPAREGGGGFTQPLTGPAPTALPHLAYADALHTALTRAGLRPSLLTAAVEETACWSVTILASWLPAHPALSGRWPGGMTLGWTHTGWSVRDDRTGRARPLALDTLACPDAVAGCAVLLARGALTSGPLPKTGGPRWEHATDLDVYLSSMEDRPVMSW